MGEVLKFDYMYQDDVTTHVEFNRKNGEVRIKNFTNDILLRMFGVNENPTCDDLYKALEDRCFSRKRKDLNILLELLGLNEYNPFKIVEKTLGRTWHDTFWIRFEGDNRKWKDVKAH